MEGKTLIYGRESYYLSILMFASVCGNNDNEAPPDAHQSSMFMNEFYWCAVAITFLSACNFSYFLSQTI
jgi:hypothetical protein